MSCCENKVPQTIRQDLVLNGKPHPKRKSPKTHTFKVNEKEKEQRLRKYPI
jgi:hypothetical protein